MPRPSTHEIELVDGTGSELAVALRNAIEQNLSRHPERKDALRRLRGRVLFRADDTDQAVTLEFDGGRLRVHDGEVDGARIRVLGDQETILALTRLRLAYGVPDLLSETGRLVFKRQLGGELTVRGLILRLPQIRHLLRVVAGG